MSYGPNPWLQPHWDWRAAANFMCGGAGSGLIVAAVLFGRSPLALAAGAALVGLGLLAVWFEIGRPARAINVMLNPRTSWMSREALVAALLFASVAGALAGFAAAGALAALLALVFVTCQALIIQAARGIPAWREPRIVPLLVLSGLAEGLGLWLAAAGPAPRAAWIVLALLLAARAAAWSAWRRRVAAAPRAMARIDGDGQAFGAASMAALAIAAVFAAGMPGGAAGALLQLAAGVLAFAGGAWFKFALITRAAFNQGFALPQWPVRGVRRL